MRKLIHYISESTLKREYALGLTVWWMWLVSYAHVKGASATQVHIIDTVTYPILLGCFSVFGMDFVAKQTNWGGPPPGQDQPVKISQTITVPSDANVKVETAQDGKATVTTTPKDDGFA